MANQFTGLAPDNVAEEVKELNYDNNQNEMEKCQEEIARLKLENRELHLSQEKLTNKLVKRKNELENERNGSNTFRQYIQDLKARIAQLEKYCSVTNRPLGQLGSVLTEEVVERLILEKTGLESQVCEQRKEIEALNSEINSCSNKLELTNQELEIARANLARSEELAQELKLDCEKLDAECKLGKDLFREALQAISREKEDLEEQLNNEIKLKELENKQLIEEMSKRDFEFRKSQETFEQEKRKYLLQIQIKDETITNKKNNLEYLEANFETEKSKICEKTKLKLEQVTHNYQQIQRVKTESETKSQEQITELTDEITALKNELTSERESSKISKQLIGKLNDDVEKLQTGEGAKVQELQILLGQSEKNRNDVEMRLVEMTKEIADRDYKIQILNQDIFSIFQGKGQVSRSPSTPVMPPNPKIKDKNAKENKPKLSDTSGATQGATNMELTPQIVPIPNQTGITPSKIFLKGTTVQVVKLKVFPSMETRLNKQVVCTVNKRAELGILICVLDLDTKVGFRNVTTKYLGIKLFSPVGTSDGTFRGKRVFECEPKYAIFVPLEDVFVPVI